MKSLHKFAATLAAALTLTAVAAQAQIRTEWIDYAQGDTKLKGYLAYDGAIQAKRPAVLLVHRRNGMDANTLATTEMYAKLGYAVFAADIFGYGQGVLPKDVPEMTKQIVIYYKDRPLMRARGQAGLEALLRHPMVDASKVALLGYCFGGTVGIELAYAGAPLAATVTIHGTFRNHVSEDAKNIKGKVLLLHGAEDTVSPLAEVNKIIEDLRKAKIGFHYELYSGAEHGFSTPSNPAEERANIQSIAATTRYLKEVFGP
jgi:dienelactone hydrolase